MALKKQEIAVRPTNNPAAYDAFLRGLAFAGRIDDMMPNTLRSADAFRRRGAIGSGLRPRVGLIFRDSIAFTLTERSRPLHVAISPKGAFENATTLQPALVETQLVGWILSLLGGTRLREGESDLRGDSQTAYPNNAYPPYALAPSRGAKDDGMTPVLFSPRQSISIHRMYSCWPTRVSI